MTLSELSIRRPVLAAVLSLLIAGGLTGVIYISDVAQRRLFKQETVGKGRMVLTIIGAFVVLVFVQLIPFLGSLAVFLLTVMGVGALKYQFMKQYQEGKKNERATKYTVSERLA